MSVKGLIRILLYIVHSWLMLTLFPTLSWISYSLLHKKVIIKQNHQLNIYSLFSCLAFFQSLPSNLHFSGINIPTISLLLFYFPIFWKELDLVIKKLHFEYKHFWEIEKMDLLSVKLQIIRVLLEVYTNVPWPC